MKCNFFNKKYKIISIIISLLLILGLFSGCASKEPDFSDPNLDVDSLDKIWQFKYYNDYDFISKSQSSLTEFISSNGQNTEKVSSLSLKLNKFSKLINDSFSSNNQSKEISVYLEKSALYFNTLASWQKNSGDLLTNSKTDAQNAYNAINQTEKDEIFTDRVFSYDFYNDGITLAAINTTKLSGFKSNDDEIVITFGGNTALGNPANDWQKGFNGEYYAKGENPLYPFTNVLPYFLNDDYTVITYEGNLTDKSPQKPDGLNGLSQYSKIIKNASIDLASVATEHNTDFYEAGFEDTIKNLNNAGIGTFSDTNKYSLETKIGKIAFFSYDLSESEPDVRLGMLDDFKKANAEKHPIIIVNFHWGYKQSTEVSAKIQKLAKQAVSYGADVVIGSHPYVIQGMSMIKNHPVVYSMGNLSHGGDINTEFSENFLFQLTIKKSGDKYDFTNYKIIPIVTSLSSNEKYMPSPVEGQLSSSIIDKIQNLSNNLENGIANLKK
ncbi:MAG: CapA family protein [Oscillospiraceae bacterium]